MSELFEEEQEEIIETEDDFEEVDAEVETELTETPVSGLDARRKLENMLEEKRLRDELDDFVDY